MTNIPIVTAGGVVKTQHGPAIAILHQYTYTGQVRIHSSGQLERYKNDVNDKSVKVISSSQCILTNNGYVLPISIMEGLPYISLCPFTDEEWDSLLHVILTGNTDWDPNMLDVDLDEQVTWIDAITNLPQNKSPSVFHEYGDYNKRVAVQNHDVLYCWDTSQHVINACVMVHTYYAQMLDLSCPPASGPEDPDLDIVPTMYDTHAHEVNKWVCNYQALWPMFRWLPADVIQQTFAVTTQYACLHMSTLLKKRYKSPFPLLMFTRGMSQLQQIPSTQILQLLTLAPPLLKFLFVLNPSLRMSMPLKLIGNSSILWKTKSRLGELQQSSSVIVPR